MRSLLLFMVVVAGCGEAPDAAPTPEDASEGDPTPEPTPDPGPEGPVGGCLPDRDGVLRAAEMPLGPGMQAVFRVARGVTLSTEGEVVDAGRRWDLDVDLAGDTRERAKTTGVEGAWFADGVQGADYVASLGGQAGLLGVFAVSGDGLELLAVASEQGGPTRTLMIYDPPVRMLRFPLALGDRWEVSTAASGLFAGLPAAATEEYVFEVDAEGVVATPFAEFDVLRLRTERTRRVGVVSSPAMSFLFLAECFGGVAAVFSEEGETSDEFEQAAEVRRLSP